MLVELPILQQQILRHRDGLTPSVAQIDIVGTTD
jgi:hypothetical protein